jgi:hypothetical protein
LARIAAACADRGLLSEGLDACQRALPIIEQTSERVDEADVYRVNGLLLAPEPGDGTESAEEASILPT